MNRSELFIVIVKVSLIDLIASSCWLERKTKTPAGKAEQVRPRRSVSNEEAHRPPAESEDLHGNQQRCHKQSIRAPLRHLFAF